MLKLRSNPSKKKLSTGVTWRIRRRRHCWQRARRISRKDRVRFRSSWARSKATMKRSRMSGNGRVKCSQATVSSCPSLNDKKWSIQAWPWIWTRSKSAMLETMKWLKKWDRMKKMRMSPFLWLQSNQTEATVAVAVQRQKDAKACATRQNERHEGVVD